MNQNDNKIKREELTDDLVSRALKLIEEGKSVPDILDMFPDQKKELTLMFKSINVLEKQKEAVVAPKDLLRKIISGIPEKSRDMAKEQIISASDVTKEQDGRYLYENNNKGRSDTFKFFNLLKLLTMKKMYVGAIVLLLMAVVVGISFRQSHRGKIANDIAVTLPVQETNELVQGQESLAQDDIDLEEMAKTDENLESINQDLADISGEPADEKEPLSSNKAVNVAYLETLESDLVSDLASLSSDTQDLEGMNNDTSLNTLDSELGGI